MDEIIYLSYDGMTDPLGQSQVLPYLKKLSESGTKIHLISCEKKERYAAAHQTIEALLHDSAIVWYPIAYHKKPPVFSTLYDLLRMYLQTKKIMRQYSIRFLHCRSYLTSLIGLRIKLTSGIPFIFDMRGFWADERIEGNIWNPKNYFYKIIYNFFKTKEKAFVQHSSCVISLTDEGKKEIIRWLPEAAHKIQVIPCCCDFNFYTLPTQAARENQRNELQIPADAFVLSYIGSLGTWYMLAEMLHFYHRLLQKKGNVYFLCITLDSPDLVQSEAAKQNIPLDKIITRSASKQSMPLLTGISDASIFFIRSTFSKKASSPTKYAELVSLNIPVICNNDIGDMNKMSSHIRSGIAINQFDSESIDRAIDQFLLDYASYNGMRDRAQTLLDISNAIDRYKEAYRFTTGNGRTLQGNVIPDEPAI